MEMAFSEISLVVFTAIAPAGAVGYIVMALVARFSHDAKAGERSDRFLVIPLLLALVGLIASATHLGTPANALYVITGLGRSPLSNEVASAAAFLALGGAYWILAFPYRQRTAPKTVLLALSVAAALAFVHFVSRAYAVESIVTWNNPIAPLTQWACAIAAGAMTALTGLRAARFPVGRGLAVVLIAVSAGAALACACLLAAEQQIVSGMRTVTTNAADMTPLLMAQIAAFVILAAIGIVCACVDERRRTGKTIEGHGGAAGTVCVSDAGKTKKPVGGQPREGATGEAASTEAPEASPKTLALPVIAVLFLLAACFVVRFAFYAMYMTAGV